MRSLQTLLWTTLHFCMQVWLLVSFIWQVCLHICEEEEQPPVIFGFFEEEQAMKLFLHLPHPWPQRLAC